jgi:hypothetical protein
MEELLTKLKDEIEQRLQTKRKELADLERAKSQTLRVVPETDK